MAWYSLLLKGLGLVPRTSPPLLWPPWVPAHVVHISSHKFSCTHINKNHVSFWKERNTSKTQKEKGKKKSATKPKSMPRLNNNNKKNQAEALFFPESGRAMEWFLSSEHCPWFLLGVCHLSIQTEKSSDGRTHPYFSCCHSLPLS